MIAGDSVDYKTHSKRHFVVLFSSREYGVLKKFYCYVTFLYFYKLRKLKIYQYSTITLRDL